MNLALGNIRNRTLKGCGALVLLLLYILSSLQQASACPKVAELIDPDCSGRIRIAFAGDSITKGIGARSGKSYPAQLAKIINDRHFIAVNIGVPGATAGSLHRGFVKYIDTGGTTTQKTKNIDYLQIQVGTNAYWKRKEVTAMQEVMRIVRLRKYLLKALKKRNGVTPVIFTAKLPLTDRSFQNPFIMEINAGLDLVSNKVNLIGPSFNQIPTSRLVLKDRLHPSDFGYRVMAKLEKRALYGRVQKQTDKTVKDSDGDGLYDDAEDGKFSTDPQAPDTDGDGVSDGDEVLVYGTDPSVPDVVPAG